MPTEIHPATERDAQHVLRETIYRAPAAVVLASAALDDACRSVARFDWTVHATSSGTPRRQALAALTAAADAYAVARREQRCAPERVVVELKELLNVLLLKHGYGGDQQALRGVAFEAFLSGYYRAEQ